MSLKQAHAGVTLIALIALIAVTELCFGDLGLGCHQKLFQGKCKRSSSIS